MQMYLDKMEVLADEVALDNSAAMAGMAATNTEKSLPVGSTINITSTAFTQPGTAAGVLRVYTTYRKIATGL